MKKYLKLNWAILTLCGVFLAPAHAAEPYPVSVLRIIVNVSAGTGPDTTARIIAERLAEQMGINVVVENREGASGQIGALAIANAPPNGSVIGIIPSPGFYTGPYLQKKPAYDPVGQFTAIARVLNSPLLIVSSPRAPFSNFEELRTQAKQNPGKFSYAATGEGSTTHLAMENLKLATGLNLLFVPYTSTTQQSTDLLGGHVSLNVTSVGSSLSQVTAGQVRALVVGSARRSPKIPDVPTFAEVSGKPGMEALVWYGFIGPKGMPEAVVNRLAAEIRKAMTAPRFKTMVETIGADAAFEGPAEFSKTVVRSAAEARQLIEHLKLTLKD